MLYPVELRVLARSRVRSGCLGPFLSIRKNFQRSGRDSNPRYAFNVYSLSRRAPSATRPPLQVCRFVSFFRFSKSYRAQRRRRDSNPRCFRTTVFKTAAFDHSATPPKGTRDVARHPGKMQAPMLQLSGIPRQKLSRFGHSACRAAAHRGSLRCHRHSGSSPAAQARYGRRPARCR